MKAEDTVMSKRQLVEVWLKTEQGSGFLLSCDVEEILQSPDLFDDINLGHSQAVARTQAEISFKAGIREVVEWIQSHIYISYGKPNQGRFLWEEWQAKLKEWGIE